MHGVPFSPSPRCSLSSEIEGRHLSIHPGFDEKGHVTCTS